MKRGNQNRMPVTEPVCFGWWWRKEVLRGEDGSDSLYFGVAGGGLSFRVEPSLVGDASFGGKSCCGESVVVKE